MFVLYQEKNSPDCVGNLASYTPNSRDPAPAEDTGADMGVTLDCPSAEGSEDMSVTNSEVESAMNHRCRGAVLRDPRFSKEVFSAFSAADAYIWAARDGLNRATEQHLKDVQVSLICPNMVTICQ